MNPSDEPPRTIRHGRFKLKRPALFAAAFLSVLSSACIPKKKSGEPDLKVTQLVESEARAFRANHDGDRREEGAMLFGRLKIGMASGVVRELLGDPTPGISTSARWVYELGGADTFTFDFKDGELASSYWLVSPPELEMAKPAVVPDQVPPPLSTTGTPPPTPTVSSATRRAPPR